MGKDKKISMIGLGRLGICTALCLEDAGWDVVGVDVIQSYVESINNKTLYSGEPRVMEFLQKSKKLRATTSMDEALAHSDLIFILVATPTGISAEHAYDTGTLSKVLSDLNAKKIQNKHIVVNCTVQPGFLDTIGMHLIRDCKNCTLSYNPEFIAQGNVMAGLMKPDMVLIGEGNKAVGDVLEELYLDMSKKHDFTPRICRMSRSSAEITKLSVNCFITTKISFANMISEIADSTPGANKFEILGAIGKDSRIGEKCLMPGFGFGGPCFPRDNRALGYYARAVGVPPLICEATDQINIQHAEFLAKEMLEKEPKRTHFVIDDVAYKPKCPVDIIEESHKLEVAKRLVKAGKKVTIKDRAGIIELTRRTYGSVFEYETIEPAANASPDSKKRAKVSADEGVSMGNPMSSYRR